MLDIQALALMGNGVFHRDHMKAQSAASGRHHGREHFQRQIGHLIGKLADLFGHFGIELFVVHQVLGAADHEHRHEILLVAILVMPVVFHDADLRHLLQQVFGLADAPVHPGSKLLRRVGLADLHLQDQLRHLVGEDLIEHPVLRPGLIHRLQAELDIHAVCDVFANLRNDLSHISAAFLFGFVTL